MFNYINKNKNKNSINSEFHSNVADMFNRKKTREKDMMRFQNIQPKINNKLSLINGTNGTNGTNDNDNDNNDDEPDKAILTNVTDIYKINNIKTSVTIDFNMKNSGNIRNYPIVPTKEILVPVYSENDNYNIGHISKNISKPVKMDMFISDKDTHKDFDINKLRKKNVQYITNVYQEIYLENNKPTGLGDFIRGSYFLLQFCEKYAFQFKIIINHPIAFFLEKFYKKYLINQQVYKNLFAYIPMFTPNNWKDSLFDPSNYIVGNVTTYTTMTEFFYFLCDTKVNGNNLFVYNIMFPYDDIKEEHKTFVRNFFEPNEEMKIYIDETLDQVGLYKNKYSVIHIRSGDNYLNDSNKIFDSNYFKKLVYEVTMLVNVNKGVTYLLIADNNEIKLLLTENIPGLKVFFKKITHLGEGNLLVRDEVKNTMLDFYLFSYSNSIYSFTSYPHGTGFSYWCAQTYNIPHKCKYIKVEL
jgi:hypothetical protein